MSTKHKIYFTCLCKMLFIIHILYYLYVCVFSFSGLISAHNILTYFNNDHSKHWAKVYILTASLFHFNDQTMLRTKKNLHTLRIKEILLRTMLSWVYWFYKGPNYGNDKEWDRTVKKKKKITKITKTQCSNRDGYAQKELTSV